MNLYYMEVVKRKDKAKIIYKNKLWGDTNVQNDSCRFRWNIIK